MCDGLHVGPKVLEVGTHDRELGVSSLDRSLGPREDRRLRDVQRGDIGLQVAIGGLGAGKEGLFVRAVAMFCDSAMTLFTFGDSLRTASGAAMRAPQERPKSPARLPGAFGSSYPGERWADFRFELP